VTTPAPDPSTAARAARFRRVLEAARAGEDWALTTLYRDLQPGVLAYARSQRPQEADDVASETWISVARSLGSFRGGEDDFRRWVFTIARRRLLDLSRAEWRHTQLVSEMSAAESSAPEATSDPLSSIETREALALVAQLPAGEAEVIVLRVLAGLSAADVAAITGRTTIGVRVTQHRALRRLRGLMAFVVTLQSRLAM
jgi:RNA polymerase sigma-70 factor (ECF subfamily)